MNHNCTQVLHTQTSHTSFKGSIFELKRLHQTSTPQCLLGWTCEFVCIWVGCAAVSMWRYFWGSLTQESFSPTTPQCCRPESPVRQHAPFIFNGLRSANEHTRKENFRTSHESKAAGSRGLCISRCWQSNFSYLKLRRAGWIHSCTSIVPKWKTMYAISQADGRCKWLTLASGSLLWHPVNNDWRWLGKCDSGCGFVWSGSCMFVCVCVRSVELFCSKHDFDTNWYLENMDVCTTQRKILFLFHSSEFLVEFSVMFLWNTLYQMFLLKSLGQVITIMMTTCWPGARVREFWARYKNCHLPFWVSAALNSTFGCKFC